MHKLICYSLALSLVCGVGNAVGALAAGAPNQASIAKDGVNLRSGPSDKNDVIWELPQGYPLRITERKGDWVKVSDHENAQGWVHKSLLSNKNETVIVTANEANLRKSPDAKANKVGSAAKEVIFEVVSRKGDWVQIRHPQVSGWIHKSLVWP